MATIEFIQKRIEGKAKEITKLEKKLERIEKAEATGWEVNPYYYDESDKRWAVRDLEEAREALHKWEAELAKATEKASSRNVKAILDFLENWKANVRKFYENALPEYEKEYRDWCNADSEYSDWYNRGEWRKATREERNAKEQTRKKAKEAFNRKWSFFMRYVDRKWDGETMRWILNRDKLEKELKADADEKYDDIIERTNEITGKITDASALVIGAKGELNGYIIGERGKAKVQTIGAGGYNIQCFHFRTLVHSI